MRLESLRLRLWARRRRGLRRRSDIVEQIVPVVGDHIAPGTGSAGMRCHVTRDRRRDQRIVHGRRMIGLHRPAKTTAIGVVTMFRCQRIKIVRKLRAWRQAKVWIRRLIEWPASRRGRGKQVVGKRIAERCLA